MYMIFTRNLTHKPVAVLAAVYQISLDYFNCLEGIEVQRERKRAIDKLDKTGPISEPVVKVF